MLENLVTLGLLILLQAVLGFDNLLYISLESKRAPLDKQKMVRTIGIGLAVVLRIVLLFLLVNVIEFFQDELFHFDNKVISGSFNFHSIIVLFGGVFILYTAVKEIWHMMSIEEHENMSDSNTASAAKVIGLIVMMNLIFSFDSILGAIALTDVLWIMIIAILASGAMMILLADTVSEFLKKNRMYEVLGLFVLLIVGIMLLTEGGHLAHLHLFGNPIDQMSKTTFYFVIAVLVLIDIVQGRYQKKLLVESQRIRDKAAEKS